MATIADLLIKLRADITDFSKKMNDAQSKVAGTAAKFDKAGKLMTIGITAPLVAAGTAAFKMASDFNESKNKVEVAFGYMSDDVTAWSETTLKSFGLAQGTALDMAATFGDMGTSMGLSQKAAADMSKQMVGLAGDMASFKNMNIGEVNTALTAVFTGETESLKRMGIVMTQVNLEQYALSQGIKTQIKDMTQAELTTLRYNYVLANTANAQGDFERTGGGAANQMRILTESIKETAAKAGQVLLPIITPIIKKFGEWVQEFGKLNPEAQKTVLLVAGIAAAIGPVLVGVGGAIKAFTAVKTAIDLFKVTTVAATAAQGGLNVAMAANPIGLVIAGIVALTAVVVALIAIFNKAAAEEKKMYEGMIQGNEDARAAAEANIKAMSAAALGRIDEEKSAAETLHQEKMALNQAEYDAEMEKGQKILEGMQKNLTERRKLLDDSHNQVLEAINAEYGVYEENQKSKLQLIEEEQAAAVQAQNDIYAAAQETYAKNIERLRKEYGVYEETTKSMIDLAKEAAAEKAEAAKAAFEEEKERIAENKKLIEERYKDEVEAAKDAHRERLKLLDEEYDRKLDIIDLGLSEEVKALQDQIDAIDGVTEAEEKAIKAQRDAEKIANLEAKIAAEEDAADRAEIQRELQQEIADQARESLLETREMEKTALEDRIKEAKTRAEEEKKALKEAKEEEKKLLEEAHEEELKRLEEAKAAKIEAEEAKTESFRLRMEEEIATIETALEGEMIAINAAREEKEAAEAAKLEAVKATTNGEITKINEAAEEAKKQNEAVRQAKVDAENAKYAAAVKSLDDEAAYLDTWIETEYKTALDAKLAAANERENQRHNLIMSNLAAEAAAVQAGETQQIAMSNTKYKINDLDIKIRQKQAEIERGTNGAFGPVANDAVQREELRKLQAERALLVAQGGSGLVGGVSGISSYAVGTDYISKDQLAYVHRGEAIVTAEENRKDRQNRAGTKEITQTFNFYQPIKSPYEVGREARRASQLLATQ